MSDLIDRQAAIEAIKSETICVEYTTEMNVHEVAYEAFKSTKESIIEIVNELPSAQPERKMGKWEKHFDGNEWFWCCSACKEQWYEEDLYMGGCDFPNYCPNCGSYNGGEEE